MSRLRRLSAYYLAGRLYRAKPTTVLFSPTLRCNLKCVHCGIWKNKKEVPSQIDPDAFGRLLADPALDRVTNLWLGGGEPTLLENAVDYYRKGWKAQPSIIVLGLIANGFLPSRTTELIRRLAEEAPERIHSVYMHLSVDGPQAIHDRIRGVEGAFSNMEKSLAKCIEMKQTLPRIQPLLNCVLQPENAGSLEETDRWAESMGVPICYNLLSLTDGFYCNTENRDRLDLDDGANQKIRRFVDGLIQRTPYPLKGHYENIEKILSGGKREYRCVTMETSFHLDGDGRSWVCPVASEETVGNVLENSPSVLWYGDQNRTLRRTVRAKLCDGCGLSCSVGDGMNLAEWALDIGQRRL